MKRTKQTRKNRNGFYAIEYRGMYARIKNDVMKWVDLENSTKFKSEQKAKNCCSKFDKNGIFSVMFSEE